MKTLKFRESLSKLILQEEKNLLEKKINLEEKLHKKFEEIQSFKNESKKKL